MWFSKKKQAAKTRYELLQEHLFCLKETLACLDSEDGTISDEDAEVIYKMAKKIFIKSYKKDIKKYKHTKGHYSSRVENIKPENEPAEPPQTQETLPATISRPEN